MRSPRTPISVLPRAPSDAAKTILYFGGGFSGIFITTDFSVRLPSPLFTSVTVSRLAFASASTSARSPWSVALRLAV